MMMQMGKGVAVRVALLLLIILGVTAGAAFALFAWRAPNLNRGGLFAPVSRESALVLNNILLAVSAFVVFIGTVWPLVAEMAWGRKLSVGAPFFEKAFTPFMVVLAIIRA